MTGAVQKLQITSGFDALLKPRKTMRTMMLRPMSSKPYHHQFAQSTRHIFRVAGFAICAIVVGCGTQPVARTDGHLRGDPESRTIREGTSAALTSPVPDPVRQGPLPPPPRARVDEIRYSVTVNEVPVSELLFAISRDTKLNIDIHPNIKGKVTLNVIDQPLKQILERISKQVDMRWEMDGPNLAVRPDSPFIKIYKVDYVNMTRDSSGAIGVQTQVVGALSESGGAGQNSAELKVENKVKNRFWENLERNVKEILRETDKYISLGSSEAKAQAKEAQSNASAIRTSGDGAIAGATSAVSGAGNQAVSGQAAQLRNSGAESSRENFEFREAASVIVNPETGTLAVRATGRQHEKILEFIETLAGSSRRQVLIEATVVEVVLNDNYQSGVDWSALGLQGLGYSFKQSFTGTNLQESPFFSLSYRNPNAAAGGDISSTLKLLNSFGNTRVLSSPKIMTLNNQTAVMRVVESIVYFTVTVTPGTTNGTTVTAPTYATTPKAVPEGFVMNVTPQVSENGVINLNIRPSVTRVRSYAKDPNPDLARANVTSLIPQVETREFETMMRISSGQTAILGGLMKDSFQGQRDGLPILSRIPILGDAVSYRKDAGTKSELVVFIRATVINDASVETDLSDYKRFLPDSQFFKDASPSVDIMDPKSYKPVPVFPEGESRKAP